MDFENFFLQPMDGPDVVENTELTVRTAWIIPSGG